MIFNLNPALIMYGVAILAIICKIFFKKTTNTTRATILTILLTGVFYILYYAYKTIGLKIGYNFLSSSNTIKGLVFFNNKYAILIVYLLCLIAISSILFNFKSPKKSFVYYLYLASAMGAITTDSLFTAFIYLETMSVFSIIIILSDTKNKNIGIVYVLIHCISGVLMLVGVVGYALNSQNILTIASINFANIPWIWKAPALIFLIGMLMNLGVPPFSYAITECYTVIDLFSAVILSTVSTKIYLLFFINNFSGLEFLYIIGGIMVIYSGVCAVFNHDLRRIVNHWMILHLGIIIAFCSINSNFDNGALGFALFMNMVSIFCVSIGVGILYDLYADSVRNIALLGFSKKNKILEFGVIIFITINIMALPLTVGFFSDAALHTNNHKLNFIHLIGQIFCFIIGAKIIGGSIGLWRNDTNLIDNKQNNTLHHKLTLWIWPSLVAIIITCGILLNINKIMMLFIKDNLPNFEYLYIYLLAALTTIITLSLIRLNLIRTGNRFGFDLIFIYQCVSFPTIKIIKLAVIAIYVLIIQIWGNIDKIIIKNFKPNKEMFRSFFYNPNQFLSLVIFIIIILASLIILFINQ